MTDHKPVTAPVETAGPERAAAPVAAPTAVETAAGPATEPAIVTATPAEVAAETLAEADASPEAAPAKAAPAKAAPAKAAPAKAAPAKAVPRKATAKKVPAGKAAAAKQAAAADEARGKDAWRRVGAVVIVLVAAVAVVVLWARPAHEPAAPGAQPGSAPVAITVLNPTDIAYLQLMISLDTSAGQLFEHIIASGDPVLGPIARTGADGHKAELAALRKALTDGGAIEDSSIHAGHDLPGMVVDADMAAIRALPAAQQPAKAAEVLRDHLTGTTALCGSEAKNGADPATQAIAAGVLDAHGKLLAQLPAM